MTWDGLLAIMANVFRVGACTIEEDSVLIDYINAVG